jgi:hypothetical protein
MQNEETEEPQQQEPRLAIYSKTAILVFSIFFSSIAGGVLLMLNLRSAGYKKEGTQVLLFSIMYYFLSAAILNYFIKLPKIDVNNPDLNMLIKPMAFSLIEGIIGGGILAEYFFRKYFPDDDYERKSVWRALLVVILIVIPLNLLLRV